MHYLKKQRMICLEQNEFNDLYEHFKKSQIISEILRRGLSMEKLREDKDKIQNIVDTIKNGIKNKEELEMFIVNFIQMSFYEKGSQICFPVTEDALRLKSIPDSFEVLISLLKEYEINDFAILSGRNLRQFQLKQYKERFDADTLYSFLDKVIRKYACNLGDTNLLLLNQSKNEKINSSVFEEVSKRLQKMNKFTNAEVLFTYNANNTDIVSVCLYPEYVTTSRPIKKFET